MRGTQSHAWVMSFPSELEAFRAFAHAHPFGSRFNGPDRGAWYAAFAPPGTPPEIVALLNGAIEKALTDKTLQENFVKGSLESIGGSPEKLDKLAKADSVKYERLVRELNISAG